MKPTCRCEVFEVCSICDPQTHARLTAKSVPLEAHDAIRPDLRATARKLLAEMGSSILNTSASHQTVNRWMDMLEAALSSPASVPHEEK